MKCKFQKPRTGTKLKFHSTDRYSVAFLVFFVNSILFLNDNRISLGQVEYNIEPCSTSGMTDIRCTDSKRISLLMPIGGYIIYGVAHQHSGGIGSTLYGEVIQHLPYLFVVIWVTHFWFSLLPDISVDLLWNIIILTRFDDLLWRCIRNCHYHKQK